MSCVLTETVFGKQLNEKMSLGDAIDLLHSMDLINIGELGEKAVSIKTGIGQCAKNTPNIDLLNGVQVKTAQTNPDSSANGFLRAWITIKNCTAPIAVIVTERITKKQYFFYIPYSGYKNMNANAVGIPFDDLGRPYTKNKWWYYNVPTWTDLCKKASAC
jgi:hypothetical protein